MSPGLPMKVERVFLRSRVARRIFLLFIVASLVPVILLAGLSYAQISRLITDQQYQQIKQANKTYGLALLDRLMFLDRQLDWITRHRSEPVRSAPEPGLPWIETQREYGFRRIAVLNQTSVPIIGDAERLLEIAQSESDFLRAGKSLLISQYRPDLQSVIRLIRLLDHDRPEQGILIGDIDHAYLFGDPDLLRDETQLCVLDQSNRPLFCTDRDTMPEPADLSGIEEGSSGSFASRHEVRGNELISYWSLFLKPTFHLDHWTVAARQSQSTLLLPVSDFRLIFIVVILLTLAIVALLSVHQIRRSLIPLERIMEGIQHISNKIFNRPVLVDSGDEFEELAHSVNQMAVTIDKQFHILATMADIDQLILSTLKIEDIVKIVLARMRDIVPHDVICVVLIDKDDATSGRAYLRNESMREKYSVESVHIPPEEYSELNAHTHRLIAPLPATHEATYLQPLRRLGAERALVLPVILKEEPAAIISLGYRQSSTPGEDDILLGCDFTNRVAVALANASWEEQLYLLAHYDALTGLPNRLLLHDRLQQALARAERQTAFVAVLFIDLDRFKTINDSLGHTSGDLLLQEVGQRLNAALRNEDTVSRIGGDEFVIVIQQFTSLKESLFITTSIAAKIQADLARPLRINGREIYTTASIGIACYPTDGQTATELLKNADTAMYHAKSLGKNNYQFYSTILNAEAVERLEMENSLRRGLERGEFEIFYQPKVDTSTRRIHGAEALLRWNHPQRGRVSPAEFIPICEEIGLIVPIGEWIVLHACEQARLWAEQGFSEIRIAVNLSPLQFRQPNLISKVAQILDVTGLASRQLEFEITESAAMGDTEKTIETLAAFNRMGIHLSIDDFGTGYSSLNYLKRFPIHTLKIDQSFIRNLSTSERDAAIVTSIVTLAHSLNFGVVAEGVETREQLDFLAELGCDEIQGYLFSRPVPADAFTRLLELDQAIGPA